jgi:DNA-binding NarL/FixJ family response regulator
MPTAVFKSRHVLSSNKATLLQVADMGVVCVDATLSRFPPVLQKRVSRYSMIRVALADDHAEMRVTLRLLLSLSKDIELVCEASNGQEAVDCVKRLQPDVLVMDIHMPILDGFAATKQIINLSIPTHVILISTKRGSFIARQAAAVGAKGFVPKDDGAKLLVPAIEAAYRGESFFVE